MKPRLCLLLACALAACRDDRPQPELRYVRPETAELSVDAEGAAARIAVDANCDWHIAETPSWCGARRIATDSGDGLLLTIAPNETSSPRRTEIALLGGSAPVSLHVTQAAASTDALAWHTFAPNEFSDIHYQTEADGTTRTYRIAGRRHFVAPDVRERIFPGNLIDRRSVGQYLTDRYADYTFRPIVLTALIPGREFTEELPAPSHAGLEALARRVIAADPQQSATFFFAEPVPYRSYRHLHLLGMGNLGIALDETVNGSPYTEQEMQRRTGLIYHYAATLFTIAMDYPERLVEEPIGEAQCAELRYIHSVAYGRTALLLVESDAERTEVAAAVRCRMEGGKPTSRQIELLGGIDVRLLRFDDRGVIRTERGGEALIERYVDGMRDGAIVPLSFTTNEMLHHGVGTFTREFRLP